MPSNRNSSAVAEFGDLSDIAYQKWLWHEMWIPTKFKMAAGGHFWIVFHNI